jgi:hypothetical protein
MTVQKARTLLLPLVLAAALAPAATARAATDVAYEVGIEASGTFSYASFEGDDDYWNAEEIELDLAYEGTLGDEVVFRDGELISVEGAELPDAAVGGTWTRRGPDGTKVCEGFDDQPASGWMSIAPQYDASEEPIPLDDQEHVYLRPFDHLEPLWSCPDDANFQWELVWTEMAWDAVNDDGTLLAGRNPFDARFELPPEAIGMGYVEQVIPPQVFDTEATCPTGARTGVLWCRLEWSGVVTFRKVWERSAPGGSPTPSPGAATVRAGRARLDLRHRRARVDVACSAACAGTVSIGSRTAGEFALAEAGTVTATARLTRRETRALRRGGTRRLRVFSGGAVVAAEPLRARAPRT